MNEKTTELSLRYHSAMPNWCKIEGLEIRAVPECEGGGFAVARVQAERIVGTAADGTPVTDLQEELRELKAEMAEVKKRLRTIANMCNAPHWNADRRWKVRDIAEGKATP